MSDFERNEGKLIPFNGTLDDLKEKFGPTVIDDMRWCTNEQYTMLNGKIYEIEWKTQREIYTEQFAYLTILEDGSIEFHTYHYNGGAGLEEIIEEALHEKEYS